MPSSNGNGPGRTRGDLAGQTTSGYTIRGASGAAPDFSTTPVGRVQGNANGVAIRRSPTTSGTVVKRSGS